jgi:NADH-quinone oxidoreductase subunit N
MLLLLKQMLTTTVLWMLINNNRYLFNYIGLALAFTAYHALLGMDNLITTKLLFNGYISFDPLTISIVLISSLIALWLVTTLVENVINPTRGLKINNELLTLIVILMISLVGLASSNSNLSLFVSIELQSLVLYILLATNIVPVIQSNVSKVSLSYLINAAMATALLLFGLSTNSSLLILIAVLWKLGIIPVHVWSLPILDNQHSIITSIYLTLAKYGILVIIGIISSSSLVATTMLTYIGLANLIIGNVLGLLQWRYQRIIVYSSIIQIGYILLVLANSTSLGISYFELYSIYTVMLLILWSLPTYNLLHSNRLLPKVQLWIMILVLFTVAGLPFMPLFWAKLDILLAINTQSLVIALISTLLSSLIYVRLIKYMSFHY